MFSKLIALLKPTDAERKEAQRLAQLARSAEHVHMHRHADGIVHRHDHGHADHEHEHEHEVPTGRGTLPDSWASS